MAIFIIYSGDGGITTVGKESKVGDTVVRRSIIDAYIELEIGPMSDLTRTLPLIKCEKVLAATVHRLQKGNFNSPIDDDSLHRLGPKPYHGWIWSDEHANDIFGRDFRYLMKQWYGAVPRIPRYRRDRNSRERSSSASGPTAVINAKCSKSCPCYCMCSRGRQLERGFI